MDFGNCARRLDGRARDNAEALLRSVEHLLDARHHARDVGRDERVLGFTVSRFISPNNSCKGHTAVFSVDDARCSHHIATLKDSSRGDVSPTSDDSYRAKGGVSKSSLLGLHYHVPCGQG